MPHRTTLSEISKALGLSVSTISKSLSNSPEISEATKKKVQDYAALCNYTPNNLAASFRKGFTNTIGLIIPNIINPFYAKVLIGIERYLDEKGYKLITSISDDSISKETKNISVMTSGYVDGVIICISKQAELEQTFEHIKTIVDNGIPLVMFDRICDDISCDKVIINDYEAAYKAVESLILDRACKHIVMTSPTKKLKHLNLRQNAFIAATEAHKDKVKGVVIHGDSSKVVNKKLFKSIREDKTIDGIFSINQKGVVKALLIKQEVEKSDNRDIKIAGFSNNIQTSYDTSLITIDQKPSDIGKESAKLLLQRIKNPTQNTVYSTKTIPVELV